MRNLLALIGFVVVVFFAAGWYLDWYDIKRQPASEGGEMRLQVDVYPRKVLEDTQRGLERGQEIVSELRDKSAKATPTDATNDAGANNSPPAAMGFPLGLKPATPTPNVPPLPTPNPAVPPTAPPAPQFGPRTNPPNVPPSPKLSVPQAPVPPVPAPGSISTIPPMPNFAPANRNSTIPIPRALPGTTPMPPAPMPPVTPLPTSAPMPMIAPMPPSAPPMPTPPVPPTTPPMPPKRDSFFSRLFGNR